MCGGRDSGTGLTVGTVSHAARFNDDSNISNLSIIVRKDDVTM